MKSTEASMVRSRTMNPVTTIHLNYPIYPRPRYTPYTGHPGTDLHPHPKLYEIMNRKREDFQIRLESFLDYRKQLAEIPIHDRGNLEEPRWWNGMLPGLDSLSLYCLLAQLQPSRYFEIGSGNSTMFARRAIVDHGLSTKILSIDPAPRAVIDTICDRCVRLPLEMMDLSVFDSLEAGDMLFVDNSHRVFTNSDVTVVFLDVLPRLVPGVIVGIHDICLPYDYPEDWSGHFYSEQYMLAAAILAEGSKFDTLLANSFVCHDAKLSSVLAPIWGSLPGVEKNGSLFWMRTT